LTNRTQFWLCNSEPKQKNHRSHDQTGHHCNSRIGSHWLDRVRSDEIQPFAFGVAYANSNASGANSGAKDAASAAIPETNPRAENNGDAESCETNARAENYSIARADENDAAADCRRSGEANAATEDYVDAIAHAFAKNDVDSNSGETGCDACPGCGETDAYASATSRRQSLSRPPGCELQRPKIPHDNQRKGSFDDAVPRLASKGSRA
jgi:hypothetical protein